MRRVFRYPFPITLLNFCDFLLWNRLDTGLALSWRIVYIRHRLCTYNLCTPSPCLDALCSGRDFYATFHLA